MNISDLKPDRRKAIALLKRELPVFVYDAIQLEGINFTLPEVQTLMDGITVGGHKLSDQEIALNQAAAWKQLIADVETGAFEATASYARKLHAIAGKNEALEWGVFRSGAVTIAGTEYMPPAASTLVARFSELEAELAAIEDIYERAIHCFLNMARIQYFYDVNKRMGRFMMNGILLEGGCPAINVKANRQLEFNVQMLDFYESGEGTPMREFLMSCLDQKYIDVMSEL